MLNRQLVFDAVARRAKNKRRAEIVINDEHFGAAMRCMYRAPDGYACFIGCLIPDDKYDRSIELKGATNPLVYERIDPKYFVESSPREPLAPGDARFLTDLQNIHDSTSPKEWDSYLVGLAAKSDLSSAVVLEAVSC